VAESNQLITLELLDMFARTGCQCKAPDPVVIARYAAGFTSREWYATCYHPRIQSFFGIIADRDSGESDWTWFSLDELDSLRARSAGRTVEIWQPPQSWERGDPLPSPLVFPLHIHRDSAWSPQPLSATGLRVS